MEQSDLKNVLKEEKKAVIKEDITIKKHKKPMQLRDIENRSAGTSRINSNTESNQDITLLLNQEKTEIFKKPWNRLDTGMKLNRIRLFSESEATEKDFNEEKQEELRELLVEAIRNNKLSKNTEVDYDIEKCIIKKIKYLTYNDDKIYLIIPDKKRVKKTSKSKSNIDRFIKKG